MNLRTAPSHVFIPARANNTMAKRRIGVAKEMYKENSALLMELDDACMVRRLRISKSHVVA